MQSRAAFERQYLTDSFYLYHIFSVIVAQPLSFMEVKMKNKELNKRKFNFSLCATKKDQLIPDS
jgi:hypothetical protein